LTHVEVEEGRRCLRERADVGNLRVVADEVAGLMVAPTSLAALARSCSACARSASSLVCSEQEVTCWSRKSSRRGAFYSSKVGVCAWLHVGDLEDGEAVVAGAGHLDVPGLVAKAAVRSLELSLMPGRVAPVAT